MTREVEVTQIRLNNRLITSAAAAPTTGVWRKGDIVFNSSPDPGESIGWICTSAGGPGTWAGIEQSSTQTLIDFGGDPTGVLDSAAALTAAAAAGNEIVVPPGTFKISSNLTLASTKHVVFEFGGMFSVDSAKTLTIQGPQSGPISQRYAGAGSVALPGVVARPEWFGATGDAGYATGGAMTASDATLTVTGGVAFTAADVGKAILVPGAGAAGANLSTTIASFTSSTEVELAVAASTTVSSKEVTWGTDDRTAFAAAGSATAHLLLRDSVRYRIASNITISDALDYAGGVLVLDSGVTATLTGPQDGPLARRFAGPGVVTHAGTSAALVISAKYWGAAGDSTTGQDGTDDTTAIQRALTAAGTCKGTLRLEPGLIYRVAAGGSGYALSVPAGVRFDLGGSTLSMTTNALDNYQVVLINGVADVQVYNGTIQGERGTHTGGTGEGGVPLRIASGASRVVARDLRLLDGWGDGITVGGTVSSDITIERVWCGNNRRNGLSIVHVTRCIVRDSVFTTSEGTAPECGIDIEPDAGNVVSDVTIQGCKVYSNGTYGIQCYRPATATCRDIAIIGCEVFSNPDVGIRLKHVSDVRVVGNSVYSNGAAGISIGTSDQSESTLGITVSANAVWDNTSHGIYARGAAGDLTRNVAIVGNEVHDNDASGIFLQLAEELNVSGNNVRDHASGNGISLTTVKYSSISGNYTHNQDKGIFLSAASHNTFSGNIVRKSAKNAVDVSAVSIANIFSGNQFLDSNDVGATGTDDAISFVVRGNSDRNYVACNRFRKDASSGTPDYSLHVDDSASDYTIFFGNDTRNDAAAESLLSGTGDKVVNFGNDANSYITSGNLGLGLTGPNNRFELKSAGTSTNPFAVQRSGGAQQIIRFFEDGSGNGVVRVLSSAGSDKVYLNSAGDSYFSGGAVAVGATSANSKSILDLTSTTLGFLPPRMTSTQRDAITSPPAGLMIYNTTTNKLNFYNGTGWEAVTSS